MSTLGHEPPIVGRDGELAAITVWLDAPCPALLELHGEAGIGKTTLWEAAAGAAARAGAVVLASRPVEVETAVSYGGLATLLERALPAVGDRVPPPRRHALEAALRLREIPGSRLDETAVALGVASVLQALAARQPVVLALEDVQWLDASSRVALTYALRSLQPAQDVRVLVACRSGGPSLELAGSTLAASGQRVGLGPLTMGALHRIVRARLGITLSRPKLARVHAVSRGNPLHALELARVLAEATSAEAELRLPASLTAALGDRIDEVSADGRRLLLAVAAAGEPRPVLLADALESDSLAGALDETLGRGLVVFEHDRVRFTHPLLASTVYGAADRREREWIHGRLARLAGTAEERARHLALTRTAPDETVASTLEGAAAAACGRGARSTGAALFEQAASLTPAGGAEAHARRLVAAADAHFQSGESGRARALLEEVAGGATVQRFDALWRLGTLLDETAGGDASLAAFEEALGTEDPALRVQAHRCLAQSLVYVGDLERAREHGDAAVEGAEALGDGTLLVYALAMQALVHQVGGRPGWREPLARALALESEVELAELDACPSAVEADTRRLALELDDARAAYERMLERATEQGDVRAESWCRFGLAAVELLAGRPADAAEHADELSAIAEQTSLMRLPALRTAAHVALLRGEAERARALLRTAVAEAEPLGELLNLRVALQLEGLLELSLGDPRAAVEPLRRARLLTEQMAVGEPSMLAFQLDEVEALAAIGDAEAAGAVLRGFEERLGLETPAWTVPLVLRGRGLVAAARGELGAASEALEAAVAAEDVLPLPLERARTLLAFGRVLRRLQRRSAARGTLAGALARFEQLGAVAWGELAREELSRIGGRAPSREQLSPTERRIAALAGEGKTNREVAEALFVTPKTVESALTRVYRKLGVRSRTELARHVPTER